MSIKLGIQKRQWLIIFLLLSLPLVLNAVAIWLDIGTAGTLQLLRGSYQPANPNLPPASLSEILFNWLPMIAFLGIVIWLVIFISNRAFFQKQKRIFKVLEALLLVLSVAKIFEIAAGFFMPLVWLPQFRDYILGLPVSNFTLVWSPMFIFPATTIILSIALIFSNNKSLDIYPAPHPADVLLQ